MDFNFDAEYTRLYPRLIKTALKICHNYEEAEDIVQESVVNALTHLKDFKGKSNLYTWLYRIVWNCAVMRIRANVRHTLQWEKFSVVTIPTLSNCDVIDRLIEGERAKLIHYAVASLPPVYCEAIFYYYFQDMTTKEISQHLGIPEPSIKARLYRARIKVREALLREYEGTSKHTRDTSESGRITENVYA